MNKQDELLKKIQNLGYVERNIAYKDQEQLDNGGFNYRYWRLPEENYQLEKSPFFHSNENDFIHFTSLEVLYSILNTGYIRLYNLINMDDKFELDYAKEALSFHKEVDDKDDKEKLFCLSMCSANEILNDETKEHLLWKMHGNNGKGVIIRISIENNLTSWYHYHLVKMFYDLKNFDAIKELNSITDNEYLDAKLNCFIKLPIYKFEDEIRLVFDNREPVTVSSKDGEILYPITYPDKLHKSDKIFYSQLPLLNFRKDKNDPIYHAPNFQGEQFEIPKLKITEIILGYRNSADNLKNIQSNIDKKLSDVNIRITDLKKYF